MKIILLMYSYISSKLTAPSSLSAIDKVLLLILSLAGVVISLRSTGTFGAGITPDSVHYISVARNFASGNGLISYTGAPLVLWPPLYPFFLSVPAFVFNVDPLIIAPIVNAILFGLIIYFTGLLMSRHLVSYVVYSLLGAVLILLSNILQDLATMAWSETLFVFLVLVFLVYLEKFLENKDRASLIILSLAVALACLTRYSGLCLIITGTLVIFFFHQGNFKSKLFSILLFILISSLPIGAWLIRNYTISGTLFGDRGLSATTLSQNLELTYKTLRNWGYFPPKEIPWSLLTIVIPVVIIGNLAVFFTKGNLLKIRKCLAQTGPIAIYILIYLSFLLYSSTKYPVDPIDWRLLSPVYVPLTILFLILINILLEPSREYISPLIVNIMMVITTLIWLETPLRETKENIYNWRLAGTGGFSGREWRNSELIKYLKEHPIEPGHFVFSNECGILYILADIKYPTGQVKIIHGSSEIPNQNPMPGTSLQNDEYDYYVWFDRFAQSYPFTKDELQNGTNVTKIIQVSDGAVFLVKRIP